LCKKKQTTPTRPILKQNSWVLSKKETTEFSKSALAFSAAGKKQFNIVIVF